MILGGGLHEGSRPIGTRSTLSIGRTGLGTVATFVCARNSTAGRVFRRRLKLDLPAVARGLHTVRTSKLVIGNRVRRSANKHGTRVCRFTTRSDITVNIHVRAARVATVTVSLGNGSMTAERHALPCHGGSTCCRHVGNVVGSFTRRLTGRNDAMLNITFYVRNVISTSNRSVAFNGVVNGANLGLDRLDRNLGRPSLVVRSSSTSTVTRL